MAVYKVEICGVNTSKLPLLTNEEKELFISIDDWFKDNLPEPKPCKNHEKVITFLKCESTVEMIEKFKNLLLHF